MKKLIFATIFCLSIASCDVLKTVATDLLTIPTTEEAAGGLKDALKQGFATGTDALSATGAFSNDALIKIFLPEDAQKVADKLRTIPGMSAKVDNVILKMNEGAENAVRTAKPIFMSAVTNMSFSDAMGILTGGKGAATSYLKQSTSAQLTAAFKPEIQAALDQVGLTRNWTELVNYYNKLPFVTRMNPDLNAHITEKALVALFSRVEIEENLIRENPVKRGTDLMKKAFAYADAQKKS